MALDNRSTKCTGLQNIFRNEANDLVKEVLGESSAYNYIDNLMKHSSD
jgi:hypothetical protein